MMKNIVRFFIASLITICMVTHANAQVSISVRIGPPPLPVYEQPYCPADGYFWIPGYWAYDEDGYYWVPGMWVLPPETGFLWTPGYWGFTGDYYRWHRGYWGRTVGYYGGIDYGYGYGGRGYYGGEWHGRTFRYNTAVTRVNTTVVHNTYINKTVVNNNIIVNNNRASFNGHGGVPVKPTRQEQVASRQSHLSPTTVQLSRQNAAKADRSQFASVNNGRPAKLAEEGTTNNPAQKTRVTENANANHNPAINKTNNANDAKLRAPQNVVSKQPNEEKVNQNALQQQKINANIQRKQNAQNQQQEHARQVNVNNQKKQVSQNQQQQAQQQQAQQINASNERRQATQNQQQHAQQINAGNERRQATQNQQQRTQQMNANNQRRQAVQQQHVRQMNVPRQQPQPRAQPNRGDGKDKH